MTDYSELVKALRCELHYTSCPVSDCKYICHDTFCDTYRLMVDAADAIEELMKNLNMASQELSWTISYATHMMRDIDELHDMVNEVYYDEL